jgi:GntR family transcriptional regulator
VLRASERLSADHASARAASVLELAADTPALVIKRVAFTYEDMPVEYRVSWVNTRRHDYLSDLSKTEAHNGK